MKIANPVFVNQNNYFLNSKEKCNYYSIQPSFEAKNPKAVLYRANKLKTFYDSIGVPYLLPNEVWSDKKIIETVSRLGKKLDEISQHTFLNKLNVQQAVNQTLPEDAKGKILIKNSQDLISDFEEKGYSRDEIEMYSRAAAITFSNNESSDLYFNFNYDDKARLVSIKRDIEHEFKHALSSRFQNIKMIDMYKNNYGVCSMQQGVFNQIFSLFQGCYSLDYKMQPVELTKDNMLKLVGMNSIEELHKSFEKSLCSAASNPEISNNFKVGPDNKSIKQFFAFLKHMSKEEKEAYGSNKRFRELLGNANTPVDFELKPLFYKEMEKFFATKERQIDIIS